MPCLGRSGRQTDGIGLAILHPAARPIQVNRVAPVSNISGPDGYIAAIMIGPKSIDPRDWIGAIAGADALVAAEGTRE